MSRNLILVIGDSSADRTILGEPGPMLPEADLPRVRVRAELLQPGGAANLAANLAAMDMQVILLTDLGTDPIGRELARDMLDVFDVDVHLLARITTVATTVKTRIFAGDRLVTRVDHDHDCSAAALSSGRLATILAAYGERLTAIVLSDYGRGVVTDTLVEEVRTAAAARSIPVFAAPKPGREPTVFRDMTVVLNRAEARAFVPTLGPDLAHEDDDWAEALVDAFGAQQVIVTDGRRGCYLAAVDPEFPEAPPVMTAYPARLRHTFCEPSGAGDSFLAQLVTSLVSDPMDRDMALRSANLAGGLATQVLGPAIVTDDAVRVARARHDATRLKIASSLSEALTLIASAAPDARSVVGLVNGCFDILHPGHLALLEYARTQCDLLVVAINTDAGVQRLKGSGRPYMALTHRMAMLAALAAVDVVVPFEQDTPRGVIDVLRPRVIIKGGEYRDRGLPTELLHLPDDVRVVYGPVIEGISSTGIVAGLVDRG